VIRWPRRTRWYEKASCGLIGGTAIAAWFAIIDAIQDSGPPLSAGSAPCCRKAIPGTAAASRVHVFHFAPSRSGWRSSPNAAERVPSAIIGFGMLFVVFEVGWVG
jgi:hypothetical protein